MYTDCLMLCQAINFWCSKRRWFVPIWFNGQSDCMQFQCMFCFPFFWYMWTVLSMNNIRLFMKVKFMKIKGFAAGYRGIKTFCRTQFFFLFFAISRKTFSMWTFIKDEHLSTFSSFWKDEVCYQILAKGTLWIKDIESLDSTQYSDFIFALVILRKRLWNSLYIPFHFLFVIFFHENKIYLKKRRRRWLSMKTS